jgi:hypothetical protein
VSTRARPQPLSSSVPALRQTGTPGAWSQTSATSRAPSVVPARRVRLSQREYRGPRIYLSYTQLVSGPPLSSHRRRPRPHRSGRDSAQGSAPIQHGVRKRRETTGTNQVIRARERAARLGSLAARFKRDVSKNPQVSARISPLEQLPRQHHALDLISPLVDLGDRGPVGSFRRSTAYRAPWYQHGSSTGGSRRVAAPGIAGSAADGVHAWRPGSARRFRARGVMSSGAAGVVEDCAGAVPGSGHEVLWRSQVLEPAECPRLGRRPEPRNPWSPRRCAFDFSI